MRTLKLTHEEIDLIEKALAFVYNTRLKGLEKNFVLLDKDAVDIILKTANKYDNVLSDIREGKKDV